MCNRSHAQTRLIRTNTRGDDDVPVDSLGPYCTEHDVFLKNTVGGEGAIPGIEYVHSAEAHLSQEETAEGFEIGAVAETSWGDRHHFSKRYEQPSGHRQKTGV